MIDWICSFGPAWLIWAACVAVITYVVCKLLPDESLEGEKISALLVVLFSGASAIGLGSVGVIDPLAAPGRLWSNPYPTIVVVVGYLALGVVASLLWLRGHLREKCEQIAAIRSSWLAAAGGGTDRVGRGTPRGPETPLDRIRINEHECERTDPGPEVPRLFPPATRPGHLLAFLPGDLAVDGPPRVDVAIGLRRRPPLLLPLQVVLRVGGVRIPEGRRTRPGPRPATRSADQSPILRNSSMLSSLLIAAAALLLAADGPPGGADHPGALVRARRATLAEMTVGAGRIFVGTVIKARDLEVPQDLPITPVDGLPRMKVREITFVVHRRLKGMESDDPVVTIRQAREFAARLETGDQVLWFLPGEGRLGLVAPIGITSGDFRITTNRTTGVKYATNLSHNVRLFDSQAFARPIPLDDLVAAVEGVLRETVAP